jgi:cell division transport system permease protein
MAGGMAAWIIISLGIHLIDDELRNLTRLYVVDFPLYHLSPEDSLTLLLLSACLGWLGAWLSVANHLWQIEPS